ncbi:MAG: hypothetical protein WCD12_12800 [Candidatus Binatus sp.]|jgi:hypothetical protein|uniref:hypothetical protein n=1 Tax=Candidatus Binatus sp. TaxID=2811406 RepID=UPI003C765D5D
MNSIGKFPTVVMFPAVVTVLFASSPSQAGGNCADKLVGNSYNCTVKANTGPETACFEFYTGSPSIDFNLDVDGTDYGCTCLPTGGYKSPSFDASANAFECVEEGTQLTAKVKSKKLSGEVATVEGDSGVFACTESATPCP